MYVLFVPKRAIEIGKSVIGTPDYGMHRIRRVGNLAKGGIVRKLAMPR